LHLDIHGKGTRTGARENQIDISLDPFNYYFDSADVVAVSDPMKALLKSGVDAIYANDPTYTVKPVMADDPEYTGLYADKSTRTMPM
jgi:hypothetical protein